MESKKDATRELKKGAIELSILAILSRGRKYGLEIIKELSSLSEGFLRIKEGTLYPALHRMEARGLVKSSWEIVDGKNPRRYYEITEEGKKALEKGVENWKKLVNAMNKILGEEE